ncbi:MAG: sensor histidine kinase, partial [Anaerolineae bacterium]
GSSAYLSSSRIDSPGSDPPPLRLAQVKADDVIDSRLPARAMSIVATVGIPNSGWSVLTEQRLSAIFSGASPLLYPIMAFLVIFFFIATITILIVYLRTVVFPLKKTLSQVQKLKRGEISNLVYNETCDKEIVQLNRLLVELFSAIQKYRHWVILAQETERQRLSHNLHDETLQGLVAVGQRLQLAQKALEGGNQIAINNSIANVRAINQLVMEEMRQTIRALRPVNLEGDGLKSVLEDLVGTLEPLGIRVNFVVEGEFNHLQPEIALATFRVAQEIVSNIKRHAHAKLVNIKLSVTVTHVHLLITDDGIGFDSGNLNTSSAENGFSGLVILRERVELVRGVLNIGSQPGHGTQISVSLPYSTDNPH